MFSRVLTPFNAWDVLVILRREPQAGEESGRINCCSCEERVPRRTIGESAVRKQTFYELTLSEIAMVKCTIKETAIEVSNPAKKRPVEMAASKSKIVNLELIELLRIF